MSSYWIPEGGEWRDSSLAARLEEMVERWCTEHVQDPDRVAQKLMEEVGELMGARIKGKPHHELAGEYGDVLITLLALARLDSVPLIPAAWAKMKVVEKREGRVVRGIFRKAEDVKAS